MPSKVMWPKTEAQERLIEVARGIAVVAAEHAQRHDLEGSFPVEAFEAMRTSGYLASPIPMAEGGGGHGLSDLVLAQLTLAKGDGSTALSAGMHLMTVGNEGTAHNWPDAARARVFAEVVRDGALVNAINSEPAMGSPRGGGRPATSITPDGPGRWRLNGRKDFATLAPVLAYATSLVAVEDGSGDVATILVRLKQPGVSVEETWDVIGMRSTGSHDILYDNIPLTDDDIMRRWNPATLGNAPRADGNEGWFGMLVGAANLGVAEAARDFTVHFAQTRQPTGYPAPIGKIPHVREQIARMEAALLAARIVLLTTAEHLELPREERSAAGPLMQVAKRLATETAIEVTDLAMRVVGGAGLERAHPLERYFRDVRTGLVNPPIEARALEQIAVTVLDRDPFPRR